MNLPDAINTGVVYTDKAQCRDCYRCVRVCPVKAIKMEGSQAAVDDTLCVGCGTCIRQCPQNAKKYRHDLNIAREIIASGAKVAASIAPSFAAVFEPWQYRRMASLLRRLGFAHVSETAVGAWHVAQKTHEYVSKNPGKAHISTACPAFISYVEKYHPQRLDLLTPIVSPMIAHGRLLKEKLGPDSKVIFIGPCVAKKQEADREEFAGIIDCVLTFTELAQWLEAENIDFKQLEESSFDESPAGKARVFPLPGGAILTAGIQPELLAVDTLSVSGFDEIEQMLTEAENIDHTLLIEPLFCPQGCVNGPAMHTHSNLFKRRSDLLKYTDDNPGGEAEVFGDDMANCRFSPASVNIENKKFTEQQITEVLAQTGKADRANQLNCGACGYDTCRDKAIAVLRGLAEPEMCIPYMRRLAESRTDLIIETSPNGIVIVDKRLNIISMNKTFKNMFRCSDSICDKPISYLIDPAAFQKAAIAEGDDQKTIEQIKSYDSYGLSCHEIVYALPQQEQYVGIFVNITSQRDNQQQLDKLKRQTVEHAQQLHDQQIAMAQQIAEFLGSSTARSEKLLADLAEMTGGDGPAAKNKDDKWLKRTYTSK